MNLGRLTSIGVGWWSSVSGGFGLAELLDATQHVSVTGTVLALVWLVFLYGLMIIGGVLVLRQRQLGVWLIGVSQLLQLPVISNGNLTYGVLPPPALELFLFPQTGFGFELSGKCTIAWNADHLPFQASLNAGAVMVLAWAAREMDAKSGTGQAG